MTDLFFDVLVISIRGSLHTHTKNEKKRREEENRTPWTSRRSRRTPIPVFPPVTSTGVSNSTGTTERPGVSPENPGGISSVLRQ